MKRILAILAATLFLLCGCQNQDGDAEKSFTLVLTNNARSDIYGVHCEYYLAAGPAGGQLVSRKPEMDEPIPEGEVLYISFSERGFPEGADVSEFGFELFAVLENGEEIPIGDYSEFPAEYGQDYFFELSGSAENGFTLGRSPVGSNTESGLSGGSV